VHRYERRSGEEISIKPWLCKGEETCKWNWITPLVISQNSNTRIYMMAKKVFRSDDRGNSWVFIAGNLPENGTVHTIGQNPEVPGLLFVGTEFGAVFTYYLNEVPKPYSRNGVK